MVFGPMALAIVVEASQREVREMGRRERSGAD
jgi:hypothetical protein